MTDINTKSKARVKIDASDIITIEITSKFNMRGTHNNKYTMSQKRHDLIFPGLVAMWKNDAPRQLLITATNPLDLTGMPKKDINHLMARLGNNLSDRFIAIDGVILQKERNGVTDSYDKPRHDAITTKFGKEFVRLGNSQILGELIGRSIADDFVGMQNLYLDNRTGPIAKYLATKENPDCKNQVGWIQYKK